MKKTLLAAALTVGFAGVANAETSVTLYGLIDTGFGYTQFKNKSAEADQANKTRRVGLYDGVQSGNRWGLRGSEDLGDGLRAVFQLESGFNLTDGESQQGGKLFGRNATIGLANDSWGSLTFGRQTNVSSRFIADSGIASPFGDSFANAAIGQTFTSAATVRADDTVVYVSPSFSGFTFAAGYSFGVKGQDWKVSGGDTFNADGDLVNNTDASLKLLTTGLLYSNGPLGLAATYEQLSGDTLDEKVKAWNLAASYDFEVVKLHAAYGQERNGTMSNSNTAQLEDINAIQFREAWGDSVYKANNWAFGVSAPLGGGKLMAGWAQSKAKGELRDLIDEVADAKTQNNYAIGYTYDLSKRTNVYAVGSYIKGYAFQDVTATQAIVGLRHRF
ncbi:MAG: porin [Corticimicrobacter sp.]|uniref:porin n=1 Tax=Corticimicrobacter sp. TaxID=2678536 RepID=UPI0032DA96F8